MPPGLPRRPPLAMRLWLSRRFGHSGNADSASATHAHSLGKAMSIESLEHMVRSRVRMFLRHTMLIALLGMIVLGGIIWAAVFFTTKPDIMKIAVGPEGSVDAKFVQVLSDQLKKDNSKIHFQVVPTSGAKGSAQAMTDHQADLAILPSSVGDSLNWPVIAILRQNVMVFIVPAPGAITSKKGRGRAGKIEKISQLSGRRVGIVTGNEANSGLLEVVLSHYGVPAAKVQVSQIDPKNLVDAVHNNQIDVIFVAGSATGQAVSGAVAAASGGGDAPTFIPVDQAEGISKRNPAFASLDIDAGTFGGKPPSPDDTLTTLSFPDYLVAHKSVSSSAVGALAKIIYSARQSLANAMPGEIKIEAPSTDKDGAVLVQQGALDYLSDNQQSFFDKYGDDIFYGMLIFPVFGSAIAGAASYFRNDGRTRRLRLLQRVLDLVRKAHAAQTLETIEQLQIDADNLVIAIIHHSEHEEFDETVRMSFAFALDQLRFAIAARRTAILDRLGSSSKAAAA